LIILQNQGKDEDAVAEVPFYAGAEAAVKTDVDSEVTKLLYSPFELITKERRMTQAILLRELVEHVKVEFNKLFQEKSKQKQDEIVKIEDKNERIREIMKELEINENVFSPVVHDDEAPERVIEVKDNEIKAEKV
jgi:hypothetical protein